ncbi:MAG: hypothetical protein WC374_13310, partial [Phycisphaerae bacterium]
MDIDQLIGETLIEVKGKVDDDEMIFTCASGKRFRMWHDVSCCESVTVEDICGDISDLIGVPILHAEESTSSENPPDANVSEFQDSFTWTFYRIGTIKGDVTIRWYGE